jgi:hypothetical protein
VVVDVVLPAVLRLVLVRESRIGAWKRYCQKSPGAASDHGLWSAIESVVTGRISYRLRVALLASDDQVIISEGIMIPHTCHKLEGLGDEFLAIILLFGHCSRVQLSIGKGCSG